VNQNSGVRIEAPNGMGQKIPFFASLKIYGNLTMERVYDTPISMPLERTTPSQQDWVDSRGPRQSRLPR
jgi:hypothetical protein